MNSYLLIFFIWFASFQYPLMGQTGAFPSDSNPTEAIEAPFSPTEEDFFKAKDHIDKEADNFTSKFFNMLFVLTLLIGFMILASWMLKRMARSRVDQLNTASEIKVLETRHLSPKATIYLLDVMGQGLVIAESHIGISHLTTISLRETEADQPPLTSPKTKFSID